MKRAKEILNNLRQGSSTQEEKVFLANWLDKFQHPESEALSEAVVEESLGKFKQRVNTQLSMPRLPMRYVSVAALLLICFSLTAYFLLLNPLRKTADPVLSVAPAMGRAILSFENGKQMSLDNNAKDTTLMDMGIQISKDTVEGLTIIQAGNLENPIVYHTLKTPFAGVVKLKLEDGSLLDINAGTTVQFPSTFKGLADRRIYVDGEAFLTVASDKLKPFRVISKNQMIEVLGTKFNINSYKANSIKTTLLEGSVKVRLGAEQEQELFLKPGEQSIVNKVEGYKIRVDLEKELDWKNGEFYFEDSPIVEVMDKLARWYDVTVDIAPSAYKLRLNGVISRKRSLQEVLHLIEKTGKINIKLKERRIYVK